MLITLITSWYDEQPDWLYGLVASVNGICSHVVAVDGAYALYPYGRGRSAPEQAAAITQAARDNDLGLTLYEPGWPWVGNECEKRNMMFRLAAVTEPDWMLILDGDERVLASPINLHDLLESTDAPAVDVCHALTDRPQGRCRKLYRPPLRVGTFHAEYLNPAGVDVAACEAPYLDSFIVEHRKDRAPERKWAADRYYALRDKREIEYRP